MHECMLCERDMKKSKSQFGNGCINNIFKFLDMKKPARGKNKEQLLYRNIMNKTNISRINKEQKIWLADRYLTYQYLDKLHYGNFDKLKEQINTDIDNINQVEKFEEMITTRKMKLKEAYDLYKKERKFENNLSKLENSNYEEDDEKLKLLITSFSYIFNMYRNKNQYEKNRFKEMQYAFWQTVIEVGGRYANFKIAAEFLQHSLEEKPEDLFFTEGKVVEEIKKQEQFQKTISKIIKKYGSNNNKFVFDSNVDEDFPVSFSDKDLYFAINKAELKMIGKKQNENWNLDLKLHDTYDYSDFKNISDYYFDTNSVLKSIFSSTLYNFAYYSMKFKVMKEYKIDVQFEWNNFKVVE